VVLFALDKHIRH